MKIQQSAEDYLETILILGKTKNDIRAIDIANKLGFSKPSVSIAMKNLRENGYICVDENGFIKLLEPGLQIAETIYERHTVIAAVLEGIGVPKDIALEDACRIEHVISPVSFEAIKKHSGKG